jgi:hypothetical protein
LQWLFLHHFIKHNKIMKNHFTPQPTNGKFREKHPATLTSNDFKMPKIKPMGSIYKPWPANPFGNNNQQKSIPRAAELIFCTIAATSAIVSLAFWLTYMMLSAWKS